MVVFFVRVTSNAVTKFVESVATRNNIVFVRYIERLKRNLYSVDFADVNV